MTDVPVLFQTHVPPDVRETARNAVAGMQKVDASYSMRTFIADAVLAHAQRLANEHNGGKPWPKAKRLPTGRRPAAAD
ncbi:hypothetical protein LWC34_38920 [Kibdelosporangium philippinense]|uniref:Centromere-binding protein ParB C-terminal domain-containing protein n=1 Tax=Kibdelosporangium philippinense TaxID=211113 RepID=A0ABS8ZNG5_9PSEU|nr:hypothetical protein [Kibdelosporangium philippinense]MCE7008743.1 hypothetical protein [Kibdelosporangium philippinense]